MYMYNATRTFLRGYEHDDANANGHACGHGKGHRHYKDTDMDRDKSRRFNLYLSRWLLGQLINSVALQCILNKLYIIHISLYSPSNSTRVRRKNKSAFSSINMKN
jgi:hypothetical protein